MAAHYSKWRLACSCGLLATLAASGAAICAADASTPASSGATASDPVFAAPYVDADEWRDSPVRHRYIHGGFKGTDTRFSFYFPTRDHYRGRFFQHFTPAPDNENLAQHEAPGEESKIGFSIASGGYFVETNGGGISNSGGPGFKADPTIGAYRANAAAAQFSRVLALRMYGGRRPYGYAFGGSGGAYRTVGSIENTRGVWDGVVPYVLGSSNATPSNFTVRMNAMRLLDGRFPQIVDAVEPGGSGDPYAGLTPEQAGALREATRMGFDVRSWFGWRTMGLHAFPAVYGGMVAIDPGYFTDFWTRPGYLGFDHPNSFDGYRLQYPTTVAAPITAAEATRLGLNTSVVNGRANGGVDNAFGALQGTEGRRVAAFRLSGVPPTVKAFLGGEVVVRSGAAAGKRLPVLRLAGDIAVLGIVDPAVAAQVRAGDAVTVDNSNFLAAQTFHRHQLPGPEFVGWNQFRRPDGTPLYPQRPRLLGPLFTQGAAGTVPTGRFDGKMILVESLWDREAFPWQADWYRALVRRNLGDRADDSFRLWYTDHALHGDASAQEDPTHTVSYLGVLQQALRDLAAWVEKGTPPPRSTQYRIEDARVIVPATAAARGGIQPVVTLTANGGERADVAVGRPVVFAGTIALPPKTGAIVAAAWDLDGSGHFADPASPRHAASATVRIAHSFDRPGTYFVTLRAVSQRAGDGRTPYARVQNLARVRVVVS